MCGGKKDKVFLSEKKHKVSENQHYITRKQDVPNANDNNAEKNKSDTSPVAPPPTEM
jgi:hypothetical protein